MQYDVVVVGAGAAGLVAAFRAAERGRRTLLIEKNKRPGVKILISGGTRCNLTHDCDNRGIIEAYGTQGRFLHSALAALSVQQTLELFAAEGLTTYVEPGNGKVFPQSDRATDVLASLMARLQRSGATLALQESLLNLERLEAGLRITTTARTLDVPSVVLTTGGQSFPGCGTTGDGYRLATALGHTIVPPVPALTPITTNAAWVLELKGITLPDVTLSVWEGTEKLAARRSSLLFAHFGLTGPAALDVSRVVARHATPQSLTGAIDLLPDWHEQQVIEKLRDEAAASGRKTIATLVAQWVPQRIADVVLHEAGVPGDRRAAELPKTERTNLARILKRLAFPLSGTLGFKKAEVTAGGVSLAEVDSRTMQSKLVPGLYFAGEVLDLDGPIGGYNFQAAWSTGWLAGSRA